jgi:PPOX class probable F420-dependent enzyme
MDLPLDSVRELIESGPLAHLVTLNVDGSPQVTIVWIGIAGDEVVSGHLFRHRKVENILRDPRVALSLEAPGANAIGMRNYAVIYGQARITEGGAPELCSGSHISTSDRTSPSHPCPIPHRGSSRASASSALPGWDLGPNAADRRGHRTGPRP